MPTRVRLTPQQIAVREYIRQYKKLSKRVDLECRVMEAGKMLKVAREFGTNTQRTMAFKLVHGRYMMLIGCTCDDLGCPNMEEHDGEVHCRCRLNESLICKKLYPYGQNGMRRYYSSEMRP